MRRNILAAFGLSLGIVGTVISITAIVLAGCGLGGSKRMYRHQFFPPIKAGYRYSAFTERWYPADFFSGSHAYSHTQLIRDHGYEFAVCRLAAGIMDSTAEI